MLYLSSTSLSYSTEDFVNIHLEVYEQVNRVQYTFVNKYINKFKPYKQNVAPQFHSTCVKWKLQWSLLQDAGLDESNDKNLVHPLQEQ
jgi:hypothetical protein